MATSQGSAVVTAGPIPFGPLEEVALGFGFLVVAFLTWAGISITLRLRRSALAARPRTADDDGGDDERVDDAANGVIIGVGLLLGLLAAGWLWMSYAGAS